MTDQQHDDLDKLAHSFRMFAENAFRGSSLLYERLALAAAEDREVLALVSGLDKVTKPLLLFGAIHYLMLKGAHHPLAGFYPTLTPGDTSTDDSYPAFRDFCLQHKQNIRETVERRTVQTNEVRRCSSLLPGFGLIGQRAGGKKLAIVEIGTSAGFNLLLDRYAYLYDGVPYGDQSSPVIIECSLRGSYPPPLPRLFPEVGYRVGIDLNPIDVRDPDDALWLTALIWPEHRERRRMLQNAIRVVSREKPEMVRGDVFEVLPEVVRAIPADMHLCLFHSYTVGVWPPGLGERLSAMVDELARGRDLYRLSVEWFGGENTEIRLEEYREGLKSGQVLAHCDPHGKWLEWLAAD